MGNFLSITNTITSCLLFTVYLILLQYDQITSITYLIDRLINLILETTDDGNAQTTKYFVWGLDLSQSLQGAGGIGGLIASVDGADTRHFCHDGNGNVGQLVNSSDGSIAAQYEYDPYGNTILASGDYTDSNTFRFSTKFFDIETELYYYGYRYYSSDIGRWLRKDMDSVLVGICVIQWKYTA